MTVGTYVSGTGHAVLLVWMVAGWGMAVEPLPFEVTEVSVVSGEEFAALTQGVQPDQPADTPPAIEQPQVEETPPAPIEEAPPEVPDAPPPVEAPAQEAPPEAPDLSLPETDVTDTPPDAPDTPQLITPPPSAELGTSLRPVPRPAPRVAPVIITPPEQDVEVAPDVAEAATEQPTEAPEDPVDPVEADTAPEAAADEIVTEAEDPAFAPEISRRPQTRPSRPAVAETPADDAVDPVTAALEEAGAGETQATPATDPTPPTNPTPGVSAGELSDSQKADLRREIRSCWNVGSASTAALSTRITVEWIMQPSGAVDVASIQMIGFEGGGQSDANVAFRIARSAIARCENQGNRRGYTLPPDQFQGPVLLRLTFDPSEMRLR